MMNTKKDRPSLTEWFDTYLAKYQPEVLPGSGLEWQAFRESFSFDVPSGYVPTFESLVRGWKRRRSLDLLKNNPSQWRFSEGLYTLKPLLEMALEEQTQQQSRRLVHAAQVIEKLVDEKYRYDQQRGALPSGSREEILKHYEQQVKEELAAILRVA